MFKRGAVLVGFAFTLVFAYSVSAAPGLTTSGLRWSSPVRIGPSGLQVQDVSCSSSAFCVAVGNGKVARYVQGRWTRTSGIDVAHRGHIERQHVSCVSHTFCALTSTSDTSGYVYTWNGTRWSKAHSLNEGARKAFIGDISCTSRTFCMAVGTLYEGTTISPHNSYGQAWRFNGTRWSRTAIFKGREDYVWLVSCTARTFCVASDQLRTQTYTGTWHRPVKMPAAGPTNPGGIPEQWQALTCVGTHWCAAVGDRSAVWNGSRWSLVRVSGWRSSTGLSCAAVGNCVVMDDWGHARTLTSGSWSSPVLADSKNPSGNPLPVSCPTTTWCMAADAAGYTVRGVS